MMHFSIYYISTRSRQQTPAMGNICNQKHQKQQSTQTLDSQNHNFPLFRFHHPRAHLHLLIGTYRCHRGDCLFVPVHRQYLDSCAEVRDYADNPDALIEGIKTSGSSGTSGGNLVQVAVNKQCAYRRLLLCVLEPYRGVGADDGLYTGAFQQVVRSLLAASKDITLQISNTSDNSNGLPNQILLAILLRLLDEKLGQGQSEDVMKLTVIGGNARLLQMVRFEVSKYDGWKAKTINYKVDNNYIQY